MRLFTILISAISISATAQTASDFTIDDIDGNTRNLFTELNNGKVVMLDFFTNWCPICNNSAASVNAFYNDYMTNGDPVVFWALDRDQNETNADATTFRDNNSIPFPVIGEAFAVAQQFGVVYQPEYYIIKPDRSYVKKTSHATMKTAVDEALASLNTGVEDLTDENEIRVALNTITWMSSAQNQADLQIFDASGRAVLNQEVNGQQTVKLDLPAGVYVYQLKAQKDKTVVGKLGIVK